MEKIIFEDYPSTKTPISANNLNKIQDNAENAINGVILYENADGSKEAITLSDNLSNYKFIEIFYKTNDGIHSGNKIYMPEGKSINLSGGFPAREGEERQWIKETVWECSGNKITPLYFSEVGIYNAEDIGKQFTINIVLIYLVVGYK